MTSEIVKPITANNFEQCMSQEYKHLEDKYPKMEDPQKKAVALNVCRKQFPQTSKARILRLLEKSDLEKDESLIPLIQAVKKSLNRQELIEYCVLLRSEGYSTLKVAESIPFKTSWVKKYINPVYNIVTEIEDLKIIDLNVVTPIGQIRKSIMKATPMEIDEEKREFTAYATAEVRDSENEVVESGGVAETMPIYMERGSPLLYGHSNRHVGKVLKWKKDIIEVEGTKVPAIWFKGKVFSHYRIDDEAWKDVLFAKQTGRPVISIGATPTQDRFDCDSSSCHRVVEKEQLYEISITELRRGSQGANPEAKIERTIKDELSTASLLKNLYLNTVSSGNTEYQKLLAKGLDEIQASELIVMDVLKLNDKKDEKKNTSNPDEEVKTETQTSDQVLKEGDLVAILKDMHTMLKSLMDEKQAPPAPEEEEEEEVPPQVPPEEETEEKEEPPKEIGAEEALTLSKEQLVEVAKAQGFQLVETTTPTITSSRTEMAKRTAPKKKGKLPTSEELSDAMRNVKNGGITKLSQKYGFED